MGKCFKSKKLNEGASNFWSMKDLPLLIFGDEEWVADIAYDITVDELSQNPADEDEYDNPQDNPEWDKTYEDVMDKYFDYCILTEDEQNDLKNDVQKFNDTCADDEEIDIYEYEVPEVEIKPGYYEAFQLYCDTKYLDNKTVEKVRDFFKEMEDKYGLTQLGVSYSFSNGETGYHKIEEK